MKLSDFKVLTFDCYGTLIDWESGILTALRPLVRRAGVTLDGEAILAEFATQESEQQAATPDMRYADLLTVVHARPGRRLGRAGRCRGERTVRCVDRRLAAVPRYNRCVACSGGAVPAGDPVECRSASFRASTARLGIPFHAIYTAQDIGSYKPDPRNFTWLIDRLAEDGFQKSDILHVAQSLYHDHAPANAMGLASAWIDRRHGATGYGATAPPPQGVHYDFCFKSLAELVEAAATATPGC